MKIGIIGAGTVGGNLGKGWAAKNHEIMFSSRNPASDKIKALLAEVGPNAKAGTIEETAQFGEVIAAAMPGNEVVNVLEQVAGLQGKILIDANNRFGGITSLAEDIARATGARVVKAFNTIGTEHYLNPVIGGQQASMLIAGDDAEAKRTVGQLAADLGFDVVDAGPLNQAVLLEKLAQLWVSLARGPYGRNIAFKLLRG
jgi:8-hydroxy-5-deazaflavin:NADPH oxidoreductase